MRTSLSTLLAFRAASLGNLRSSSSKPEIASNKPNILPRPSLGGVTAAAHGSVHRLAAAAGSSQGGHAAAPVATQRRDADDEGDYECDDDDVITDLHLISTSSGGNTASASTASTTVRNAAAAAAASDLELDTLDLLGDGVDSPLTSLSTMAPLDDDDDDDDDDDGPHATVPMPSIAGVPPAPSPPSVVASANAAPPAADSVLTRMPRLHLPPSSAAAALSASSAVPKKPVSKNNK